jgi:hypothetical protein
MLASLLAVSWEPELRGITVVLVMVIVLIGGTYLLVGTNLGARLGFMVTIAALAGWMMSMGIIWWIYGIGLKGPEPSWKPAEPIAIVRDAGGLVAAEALERPVDTDGLAPPAAADKVAEQLAAEGWTELEESDPGRGQASASSDEILQIETEEFAAGEYLTVSVYDKGGERWPKINESLDFLAFFHEPRYALVEVAPVIPQRTEPGRAPARPVIDESQPHRYVMMVRDLGARRQPSVFITLGSGIIFALMCVLLHRRDAFVMANRKALESAKA